MIDKHKIKKTIYIDQYKQKIHFVYIVLSGTGLFFFGLLYYFIDTPINLIAFSLLLSYPIYRGFINTTRVEFFDLYAIKLLIKFVGIFKNAHKMFYK